MKYLLLNPLSLDNFNLTSPEELMEALAEFGATVLTSKDMMGNDVYFAVTTTTEAMEQMVNAVDLPGVMVEFSGSFSQDVEVETLTKTITKE